MPRANRRSSAARSRRTQGSRAAADEPAGPTLLGDVCPELAAAIDEGAWGEALVDIWAEDLSTNAFEELARLVASYEQPPAAGRASRLPSSRSTPRSPRSSCASRIRS